MKGFLDNGYTMDALRGTLVSDQAYQASWNIAVAASATAAVACVGTWATDFRGALPKIDVPMLVVQGDAAQATGYRRIDEILTGYDASGQPGGVLRTQHRAYGTRRPGSQIRVPVGSSPGRPRCKRPTWITGPNRAVVARATFDWWEDQDGEG